MEIVALKTEETETLFQLVLKDIIGMELLVLLSTMEQIINIVEMDTNGEDLAVQDHFIPQLQPLQHMPHILPQHILQLLLDILHLDHHYLHLMFQLVLNLPLQHMPLLVILNHIFQLE